jgi:hypothetical protein
MGLGKNGVEEMSQTSIFRGTKAVSTRHASCRCRLREPCRLRHAVVQASKGRGGGSESGVNGVEEIDRTPIFYRGTKARPATRAQLVVIVQAS